MYYKSHIYHTPLGPISLCELTHSLLPISCLSELPRFVSLSLSLSFFFSLSLSLSLSLSCSLWFNLWFCCCLLIFHTQFNICLPYYNLFKHTSYLINLTIKDLTVFSFFPHCISQHGRPFFVCVTYCPRCHKVTCNIFVSNNALNFWFIVRISLSPFQLPRWSWGGHVFLVVTFSWYSHLVSSPQNLALHPNG